MRGVSRKLPPYHLTPRSPSRSFRIGILEPTFSAPSMTSRYFSTNPSSKRRSVTISAHHDPGHVVVEQFEIRSLYETISSSLSSDHVCVAFYQTFRSGYEGLGRDAPVTAGYLGWLVKGSGHLPLPWTYIQVRIHSSIFASRPHVPIFVCLDLWINHIKSFPSMRVGHVAMDKTRSRRF